MDGSDTPAPRDTEAVFLKDVLDGLSKPQKSIPSRWFYDQAGSELFEQITELPEYYPTRTEIGILNDNVTEIAEMIGDGSLLIEYGAGASTKTRILLDALPDMAGYVPIDVSEDFLLYTADALRTDYPNLPVFPVVGNFMSQIALPDLPSDRKTGFFPGSTIGNLDDDDIEAFLNNAHDLLGVGNQFLLGVDLRKSPDILIPAYDDAQGVTAAFNLNLLTRINSDLGADFNLDAFSHEARWNDAASRIEMHLVSQRNQSVSIGGKSFAFHRGESIHTENSRKFSIETLTPVFEKTGWTLKKTWSDTGNLFAVVMLSAI
jgi:dimethylhistidine N-methyltransferase